MYRKCDGLEGTAEVIDGLEVVAILEVVDLVACIRVWEAESKGWIIGDVVDIARGVEKSSDALGEAWDLTRSGVNKVGELTHC